MKHQLPTQRRVIRRLLITTIILAIVVLGSIKGWRISALAVALRSDLVQMESLAGQGLNTTQLAALCDLTLTTVNDARQLHDEARPLLPIAPWTGWVPRYGRDLVAAPALLAASDDLGTAATTLCQEARAFADTRGPDQTASLVRQLASARPALTEARASLMRGAATLAAIPPGQLSPTLDTQRKRANHLLPIARDGIDLALMLPLLLGADGPRSYLVITQNPDELRPTGGFISAAGLLRIAEGRILSFNLTDSTNVDTLAAGPYPLAPEPMRRYMVTPPLAPALWVFRDANWSPDFPSAAHTMLDLYQLGQGIRADGVIAFNPNAIRALLTVLGPVSVDGTSQAISADNVIDYMHSSWTDAVQQGREADRKNFLNHLGAALLQRLQRAYDTDIVQLARTMQGILAARDIAIYCPDPSISALLTHYGWDGALRQSAGDFLMVVSANIGYNKVNPHIQQRIRYDVDLSNPAGPTGATSVTHTNTSQGDQNCAPALNRSGPLADTYAALTEDCYWNYLRIFVPGDSTLAGFSVPNIPGTWLLSGIDEGGRVASEAGEAGKHIFGALLVVARASTQDATFRYTLPASVMTTDGAVSRYRLVLQRQPGEDQSVTVQILLPPQATLVSATPTPDQFADHIVRFNIALDTDREIEIVFQQ